MNDPSTVITTQYGVRYKYHVDLADGTVHEGTSHDGPYSDNYAHNWVSRVNKADPSREAVVVTRSVAVITSEWKA